MDRLEAARHLTAAMTDEIVITSLGNSSWAWYTAGDRPLNFYTQGSMGLVSSIGLGLALARPDRMVITMEGEGSMLMNLGTLASIAAAGPRNLCLVVWDDAVYGTTGGQVSRSPATDLAGIGSAAGLSAKRISTLSDLVDEVADTTKSRSGPTLLVVTTSARTADELQRSRIPPVVLRHRVMEALGTCRCHPKEEQST